MSSIKSKTESLVTSDDLPTRLADALANPLAHRQPCRRMSPQLSYGRHLGPAPSTARHAAVMLLLFRRDGRWHLPITERPTSLARHAGQISLPGGTVEPGETSEQAAVRELREELGVEASLPLDIQGQLADCYVFATDFVVTPWVAVATQFPHWRPDAREVQQVIDVPLDVLLNKRVIGSLTIQHGPLTFRAPCYCIDGFCVWGATSVILSEFANLLEAINV
jgi:8-oxo-dGTP pyrophosphatase MutT (NUDIX family)